MQVKEANEVKRQKREKKKREKINQRCEEKKYLKIYHLGLHKCKNKYKKEYNFLYLLR